MKLAKTFCVFCSVAAASAVLFAKPAGKTRPLAKDKMLVRPLDGDEGSYTVDKPEKLRKQLPASPRSKAISVQALSSV